MLYVAIEGVDGAGKSTARKAILKWMKHYFPERAVVTSREPGGTPEGEELRTLLLDRKDIPWTTLAELCLMTGSREQLLKRVIEPALFKGDMVITDRCYLSSEAYQAITPELRHKFRALHKDMRMPDIIILVDLDPDVADERMGGRGYEKDRIEEKGVDFQHECRKRYLEAAKTSPFIVTVNSSGTPKETHAAVFKALTEAYFENTPMSIIVGESSVFYNGANGLTEMSVADVEERLHSLRYSTLATSNDDYIAQHGAVTLAEGLFNRSQALKVKMANAIRKGYW